MFDLVRWIACLSSAVFRRPPRRPAAANLPTRPRLEPLSDRVLLSADPLTGGYFPLPSAAEVARILEWRGSLDAAHPPATENEGLAPEIQAVLAGLSRRVVAPNEASLPGLGSADRPPSADALENSVLAWAKAEMPDHSPSLGGTWADALENSVLAWAKADMAEHDSPLGGPWIDLKALVLARDALDNWRLAYESAEAVPADGPPPPEKAEGRRDRDPAAAAEEGGDAVGAFVAGRMEGPRIADGLSGGDGGDPTAPTTTAEVDVGDANGSPFELATVGWALPGPKEELIPLNGAGLAVVPAYVVADAPAAPPAAPPADAAPDLRLTSVVIGPDAPPAERDAAADRVFAEMAAAPSPSAPAAGVPFGGQAVRMAGAPADPPNPADEARLPGSAALIEVLLVFGAWRLTRPRDRTAD